MPTDIMRRDEGIAPYGSCPPLKRGDVALATGGILFFNPPVSFADSPLYKGAEKAELYYFLFTQVCHLAERERISPANLPSSLLGMPLRDLHTSTRA